MNKSGVRHRRSVFRRPRRRPVAAYFGEVLPVTFPTSFLTTRVYIALGADLTASHLTWNWLDVTDRVRHDLGITITVGRGDYRERVNTSRCTIKLSNRDGYLCRRNPMSPYYGLLTKSTPIWIQLNPGSGFVDQYFGYVNEWPAGWADASGNDSFVTIQCSGIMRRLEKGRVLKSALHRTMSGVAEGDFVPLAYWPMEDGRNSTQVGSAIAGQPAARVAGTVTFATDTELAGSDALLTLSSGAVISGAFPAYTNTNQWFLQIALRIETAPAADTTYVEVDSPGGDQAVWRLYIQPGSPDIVWFVGLNSSGGGTGTGTGINLDGIGGNPSEADFYDSWWHFTLFTYIDPNDGLVYGGMALTNNGDFSGFAAGAGSSTVHRSATTWRLYGRDNGVAAGHLGFFVDTAFTTADAFDNARALDGYAGELAHERMIRLCREERIPLTTQPLTSAAMGPQPIGNLMTVLRECELADGGVLYEHQYGLAYQAISDRYNQQVAFELDFDAGHHTGVPEPRDDDQRLVNKFTASRRDGSSATAEKTDGTLGTGPGGSGVFEDAATVNAGSDGQLAVYASWRVYLGTVDEDRWPRLPFQLHRNPGLIPSWLSTPLGSRINAANPPSQMNSATIDAIIEGYTQRWVQEAWEVALATSPASPYQVGVAGDATSSGAWAQTGEDTRLVSALESGATSPLVWSDGAVFSTDLADLTYSPLSVVAGGEIMPVDAIASEVTHTFSVNASNGWSAADTGQAVTISGGAASDYSVSSGTGQQSAGSVNVLRASTLDVGSSDQDFYVDVMLPIATATGAPAGHWVCGRETDGNNHYAARLSLTTAGAIQLQLDKRVGGALSTIAAATTLSATHGASDIWRVRLQIIGDNIRAKAWFPTSDAEPYGWQREATDTSLTSGNLIGLRSRLESGNTNTLPVVFHWDNLEVVNPQRFTVTRTVPKPHAAGAIVQVHRPAVACL